MQNVLDLHAFILFFVNLKVEIILRYLAFSIFSIFLIKAIDNVGIRDGIRNISHDKISIIRFDFIVRTVSFHTEILFSADKILNGKLTEYFHMYYLRHGKGVSEKQG